MCVCVWTREWADLGPVIADGISKDVAIETEAHNAHTYMCTHAHTCFSMHTHTHTESSD